MKVTYRGECEELYGQEIEVEDHDCLEYIEFRQETLRETHGLDCGPYEEWTEHWWECRFCDQRYDEQELRDMQHDRAVYDGIEAASGSLRLPREYDSA
jgi:hypothetical protein